MIGEIVAKNFYFLRKHSALQGLNIASTSEIFVSDCSLINIHFFIIYIINTCIFFKNTVLSTPTNLYIEISFAFWLNKFLQIALFDIIFLRQKRSQALLIKEFEPKISFLFLTFLTQFIKPNKIGNYATWRNI